jgi:hypothetical protein
MLGIRACSLPSRGRHETSAAAGQDIACPRIANFLTGRVTTGKGPSSIARGSALFVIANPALKTSIRMTAVA